MTGFFSSEDAKIRAYKRNLLFDEKNQLQQAEKLEEYNLAQQGIEIQEKGLSKFAEAIGKAVSDNNGSDVKTVGKVNKLNQIATQGDVSGNVLNVKEGKIPKNKGLIASPPKMTQTNPINEQYQMGMEDIAAKNANELFNIKNAPSDKQIAAQAAAQLNLDMIAEFQQDVKEGRKRETAELLKKLTTDEDTRIRQIFMNTLDEMMDEINNKKSKRREYEEKKIMIDKIQNLIEKQRLFDTFTAFSDLASKDAYASKIQRNLMAALSNKKIINDVKRFNRIAKARDSVTKSQVSKTMNDLLDNVEEKAASDMMRNKAATTIQQRMAELRARKAAKAASRDVALSVATDIGSLADLSLRGRPLTENLTAKRLAKFQELEAKPHKTDKQIKQMKNLHATLFRQGMAAEDLPRHRPTRGSNLKK